MRTVAIIQARMGSTRFPGKVLADLGGKPVLQWVVEAARAAKGVDDVVVATHVPCFGNDIAFWCTANDVNCHLAHEHDVLARYREAADAWDADIIVRLTGDCPLLDPAVISRVIALRERTGADYASNVDPPTWPDGLDCEAFTFDALAEAAAKAMSAHEREHVTPYIRTRPYLFTCENLTNPAGDESHIKLSIDTPEELENVRRKIASAA